MTRRRGANQTNVMIMTKRKTEEEINYNLR